MENRYTFTVDTERTLLEMKLTGFWQQEERNEFKKEFEAHIDHLSLTSLGKGFYVLADITDYPPQTQETQDAIRDNMKYAIEHGMKKSARLVSQALTELQMTRLAEDVNPEKFGHFQHRQEALNWLFSE